MPAEMSDLVAGAVVEGPLLPEPVEILVAPTGGVSKSRLEETKTSLRELGLSEALKIRD